MAALLIPAIGAPVGTAIFEGVVWVVGALTLYLFGSSFAKQFVSSRSAAEVEEANRNRGEPTPAFPRGVTFSKKMMNIRGSHIVAWVRSTDQHIFVEDVSHYKAAPNHAMIHYEVYISEHNAVKGVRNRAVTWDGRLMPL
eukprot:TRINITY_DN2790_c0_g1_i1.p2 TRINITY_DN2790_c0_g1~~TRINITY_DN2790_c0_g1_i1.p2  ORF type:complete len:140 (+),score=16.19 TRINITY_DN2790_c0_g1_i1:47-466(+)